MRLYFWLLLFCLLSAPSSYASAWMLENGHSKLITSYTYYSANIFVDRFGVENSTDKFIKNELSILYEYGLNSDYNLGIKPSFVYLTNPNTDTASYAFSGLELSGKTKLFSVADLIVSFEPKIITSGIYSEDTNPYIGKRVTELELGLNAGYSGISHKKKYFIDTRLAYGNYAESYLSDSENPYLKFDITYGYEIYENWLAMPKLYTNFALSDSSTNTNNVSNPKNYSLIKPEFAIVGKINDGTSLSLGYFEDIYSRNTGKGSGLTASIWYEF